MLVALKKLGVESNVMANSHIPRSEIIVGLPPLGELDRTVRQAFPIRCIQPGRSQEPKRNSLSRRVGHFSTQDKGGHIVIQSWGTAYTFILDQLPYAEDEIFVDAASPWGMGGDRYLLIRNAALTGFETLSQM